MTEFYNTIQFGTVYITSNELVTGTKYVATVEGLDAFGLSVTVQDVKALNGTVYQQAMDIIDAPVAIDIPLMESSMYDALRDEIQGYINSPTPFTFAVTGEPENFSGTAKPRFENGKCITFNGGRINNKITGVRILLYVTSS